MCDLYQHGLCLGDVTGDGDHELVVGTDGGDLLVFKGAGGQVWRRGQDLGFITAVGELMVEDFSFEVNCGNSQAWEIS